MELDWAAVLFTAERNHLAPALDAFFREVVSSDWIEMLRAIDAVRGTRRVATTPPGHSRGQAAPPVNNPGAAPNGNRRYNVTDPQMCLRMLTDDDLPRGVRGKIKRALPEEARGLGMELRKFRNDLHHNEELPNDDILRALDSCERLLRALKSESAEIVRLERLRLGREVYLPEQFKPSTTAALQNVSSLDEPARSKAGLSNAAATTPPPIAKPNGSPTRTYVDSRKIDPDTGEVIYIGNP